MTILREDFGSYQTNCYILRFDNFEIIIDPGYGACEWIRKECTNPRAVLLTHGHHDHIWDVSAVKEYFADIFVCCPKQDSFMLESDCFSLGLSTSLPDCRLENNKSVRVLDISGIRVAYWHFPGHTPGCSMIEIGGVFFSGDFIFRRSIGRSDLPYSSVSDMRDSLVRFSNIRKDPDMFIYPGHGDYTTLGNEQKNISFWLKIL